MAEEITLKTIVDLYGEDPTNPALLREELRPYFQVRGGKMGWPMLRHPLVYQIPFMSWKVANTMYEKKLEKIEELESEGKFDSAIWFYERPYRMSQLMLWTFLDKLTLEQLRELLPNVWTDTEHPFQFGYTKVVNLFKKAGFLTDIPGLQAPVECEVYRGCLPAHKRGISWTLDETRARWFAKRLNGDKGHVYKTIAPPSIILAAFNGRDEQEILVNFRRLGKVEDISEEV